MAKRDLWETLADYPEARASLTERGCQLLRKDGLLDEAVFASKYPSVAICLCRSCSSVVLQNPFEFCLSYNFAPFSSNESEKKVFSVHPSSQQMLRLK